MDEWFSAHDNGTVIALYNRKTTVFNLKAEVNDINTRQLRLVSSNAGELLRPFPKLALTESYNR
jgi:precorrin-6B methylase 2